MTLHQNRVLHGAMHVSMGQAYITATPTIIQEEKYVH